MFRVLVAYVLEEEAISPELQWARLQSVFHLQATKRAKKQKVASPSSSPPLPPPPPPPSSLAAAEGAKGDAAEVEVVIRWTEHVRFEMFIFSVVPLLADGGGGGGGGGDWEAAQRVRPFTFRHTERSNAPGTMLESLMNTVLFLSIFRSGSSCPPSQASPSILIIVARARVGL